MIRGTVLLTGATGLIGKSIVKRLTSSKDVTVVAVVRNIEKAVSLFGNEKENLKYIVGDVLTLSSINKPIDYIIHGASQTSSKAFVNEPVETIMTAIQGTKNMLDIATQNSVKGFIYLSSMEVYGNPAGDEKITEEHSTNINTMRTRSCYPESKRMCESLCASYFSEYGVPAMVLRLTQTFGPGVEYNDGRVFAEFARCAIEQKDIILHTKGMTKRNYLYTEDAVNAILTVLEKGNPGEAYNVANEETYCSIYDMACIVAQKCAHGKIKVLVEEMDAEKLGYAPVLSMNLDTSKLSALGWRPEVSLEDMFLKMMNSMNK